MKKKIIYKLIIEIDNPMAKKFEEEILGWLNNSIGDSEEGFGEFQDWVLDELGIDDDMGFCDVGVKINKSVSYLDKKVKENED